MTDYDLLIRNGFIELPATDSKWAEARADVWGNDTLNPEAVTVISNLATYGYTLDRESVGILTGLNKGALATWWQAVKPALDVVTGSNRNMGDYMVYKNFPREVLDMSAADQAQRQLCIYFGMPVEHLTEDAEPRPVLGDMSKLKVLKLADDSTPEAIFANLVGMRNRWSDNQVVWAEKLIGNRNVIVVGDYAFKENGVRLAAKHFADKEVELSTGTDALRLAAALSDADISLRETVKLRAFKRPERRKLLASLDACPNLAADMAERPGQWKRLMEHLRPGDYKFENVKKAYDDLYHSRTKTFASRVDPQSPDIAVLDVAVERPGEFLRRFHHLYDLFGDQTVDRFLTVLDKLTNRQLVSLRAYLGTINYRSTLIYAPKSNWTRAQIGRNTKKPLSDEALLRIDSAIGAILSARLAEVFPEGIALDPATAQIKLQTNDQKLAEYGRGTMFDIAPEVTFIRSASYWENVTQGANWFDNGWNFFGENWESVGACSWGSQQFGGTTSYSRWGGSTHVDKEVAAIFSGDPVNTKELKGRACQMADLYLDKLVEAGVRYAVWSVLCYSNIKFSDATDVLATLQMGENAETGKAYEPSRAQMIFPLKSEALTSYVAYLDLKTRKIVYMDAALSGSVTDANQNGDRLSKNMPAYVEYLEGLPSVHDLMRDAPKGSMPVRFTDAGEAINTTRAFVFRPVEAKNSFAPVSLADLVG